MPKDGSTTRENSENPNASSAFCSVCSLRIVLINLTVEPLLLYISREEYIDLLQYAQARNVRILPEFNMPAHARAAVISMEARAKKGDDTYRLIDPDDETYLLTIQFYDRTSIINPCLDSSVRFVEKLVKEVNQMHDQAGVPLDSYHFGGDEAKNILLGAGYSSYPDELKQQPFSKSLACQAKVFVDSSFDPDKIANYWAITVNRILAENGIGEMVAWEDGLRGTTKDQYGTQSVAVNFWETLYWGGIDGLANIADDGFDIIMSNPDYLYFDFPYEVNPEERGYYWAARFNSVYKVFTFAPENLAQNAETSTDRDGKEMSIQTPNVSMPVIRGMQGQTWSETIRTDDQYYEMAFPRVMAVAERAWHRASWELDWSPLEIYSATTSLVPKNELASDFHGFVTKLGCHEISKMKKLGINYRVPPPGASIDAQGVLTANSEMPCTTIMYRIDKGSKWSKYTGQVEVGKGKIVYLQSMSSDGLLKSRVVVAEKECTDCGENVSTEQSLSNPDNNFCGSNREDASRNCVPCPSGSLFDCDNPNHGCIKGVAECSSFGGSDSEDLQNSYSSGGKAAKLASKLHIMINMGENFDHSADCSMADWGLCHTQDLILEYQGADDYLDK